MSRYAGASLPASVLSAAPASARWRAMRPSTSLLLLLQLARRRLGLAACGFHLALHVLGLAGQQFLQLAPPPLPFGLALGSAFPVLRDPAGGQQRLTARDLPGLAVDHQQQQEQR